MEMETEMNGKGREGRKETGNLPVKDQNASRQISAIYCTFDLYSKRQLCIPHPCLHVKLELVKTMEVNRLSRIQRLQEYKSK